MTVEQAIVWIEGRLKDGGLIENLSSLEVVKVVAILKSLTVDERKQLEQDREIDFAHRTAIAKREGFSAEDVEHVIEYFNSGPGQPDVCLIDDEPLKKLAIAAQSLPPSNRGEIEEIHKNRVLAALTPTELESVKKGHYLSTQIVENISKRINLAPRLVKSAIRRLKSGG